MLFGSKLFILGFLPVAIGGFLCLARLGRRAALCWILFCSLVFYAWGEVLFIFLLLGSTLANYYLGRWVDRHGGHLLMTTGSVLGTASIVGWSQVHTVAGLYAVFMIVGVASAGTSK